MPISMNTGTLCPKARTGAKWAERGVVLHCAGVLLLWPGGNSVPSRQRMGFSCATAVAAVPVDTT